MVLPRLIALAAERLRTPRQGLVAWPGAIARHAAQPDELDAVSDEFAPSRSAAGGIQTVGGRSPRSRSARRSASTRSFLRRAAAMAFVCLGFGKHPAMAELFEQIDHPPLQRRSSPRVMSVREKFGRVAGGYLAARLRRAMCTANPTIPEPTRNSVEGSGTASVPSNEKAALNVGAVVTLIVSTMSVPTRIQSGSRFGSRVHVCKSVTPGGNGVVPAPLIGREAESQKNSPPLVR